MAKLTPMMEQYMETKRQYGDAILFYRLGDFYEMFFDDAALVSDLLGLTLTSKACGLEEKAPMCGVPFHSADTYISKLVSSGYKVAVCEQLEDPSQAKGLVKRDVVRVITKGSIIESNMLDESKNNYLTCVYVDGDNAGVCFADVSTGVMNLTVFSGKKIEQEIVNELGVYLPSEVLLSRGCVDMRAVKEFVAKRLEATCEVLGEDYFGLEQCLEICKAHFSERILEQNGISQSPCAVICAGAALKYLKTVSKIDVSALTDVRLYSDSQFMKLDYVTKRNLEIVETMRSREKKGSLLWVLDKTKTSMGKRMLRSWLEKPLLSVAAISKRLGAVQELIDAPVTLSQISESLKYVYDIERLITRIVYETANARELCALSDTSEALVQIKSLVGSFSGAMLSGIFRQTDELKDIKLLVDASINPDAPLTVREGELIKDGFNSELDSLRDIEKNGKKYIADIEAKERERTGIAKLKVGYNRVFGYYIEVSNSYKALVPNEYVRRQTLSNCERYITEELKALESKVLGARERIVKLEYEIFAQIRKKIAGEYNRIKLTAQAIAGLDVLCSLATVAIDNNYCRPQLNARGQIDIIGGRHPVVEKMLTDSPFVPNDTHLDCGDNRCAVITGPNMAGKSTYMRQTAAICLMAQIGSFVPAESADLCIVDSIFTRVGASDDLSSGQSTFMVEMSEVSSILQNATSKSLVILDEVGRGTSTYDGMSIARAVLEYICDKRRIGAKTLFSTHYHELTALEGSVDGVKNYNISVKKRGDDITFLRRIVPGRADGSYGVEVAKLAGVPQSVIIRAKVILRSLEENEGGHGGKAPAERMPSENESDEQLSLFGAAQSALLERICQIDIETLTPLEALTTLNDIVKSARENKF